MNAPLYKGSALAGQTVGSRVVACGCGKTYSSEAFAKLPRVGRQDAGDATYLMLANCVCGSTMGMPWCGTDGCVCRDVLNHGEDAYAAGADFSGCAR